MYGIRQADVPPLPTVAPYRDRLQLTDRIRPDRRLRHKAVAPIVAIQVTPLREVLDQVAHIHLQEAAVHLCRVEVVQCPAAEDLLVAADRPDHQVLHDASLEL